MAVPLIEGREGYQITAIGDALQKTLVNAYELPERDRFQIITEHPAGRMIALDVGLGIDRSNVLVIVQIFTQAGRSTEAKQEFFAALAHNLEGVGVGGLDLIIGFVENTPADWSFGFGRARYSTGELEKPGS